MAVEILLIISAARATRLLVGGADDGRAGVFQLLQLLSEVLLFSVCSCRWRWSFSVKLEGWVRRELDWWPLFT